MPPDALFQIVNPLALLGWVALAISPFAPRAALAVAGTVIPVILSVAYAGLVMAFWSGAAGGFGSLADVQLLFTDPNIALAGWVHYLAFDLFVGAWATRVARDEGIPHLFLLPCLGLTFLFGPAGFVVFSALRFTLSHLKG